MCGARHRLAGLLFLFGEMAIQTLWLIFFLFRLSDFIVESLEFFMYSGY